MAVAVAVAVGEGIGADGLEGKEEKIPGRSNRQVLTYFLFQLRPLYDTS